MTTQQALGMPDVTTSPKNMDDIWTEAFQYFQTRTNKSLLEGPIKNFDDVLKEIGVAGKEESETIPASGDKMKRTKNYGLESLYYLKVLVSVASSASTVVCTCVLFDLISGNLLISSASNTRCCNRSYL